AALGGDTREVEHEDGHGGSSMGRLLHAEWRAGAPLCETTRMTRIGSSQSSPPQTQRSTTGTSSAAQPAAASAADVTVDGAAQDPPVAGGVSDTFDGTPAGERPSGGAPTDRRLA